MSNPGTVLALACVAFAAASAALGGEGVLSPIHEWHDAYLVVSNVGSSQIYAMKADGTFDVYRPEHVDGNPYPCEHFESRDGSWCVASGRLYRTGPRVVARTGPTGSDVEFYVNSEGKVCALPNEADLYDGQCEDEGRREAVGYFATWPRKKTDSSAEIR